MLKRDFLTYAEAAERVGGTESLRQALLRFALHAYVEIVDLIGCYYQIEDEKPVSGRTEFATWHELHGAFPPMMDTDDGAVFRGDEVHFLLEGWFTLERPDVIRLARNAVWPMPAFTGVTPAQGGDTDTPAAASVPTFEVKGRYELDDTWFAVSEIEQSMDEAGHSQQARPLDQRERVTLLCIIGALAKEAKLDLTQPMKAGGAIAAMMPGVKLSGRAIGEHLKAVREAMDSRTG